VCFAVVSFYNSNADIIGSYLTVSTILVGYIQKLLVVSIRSVVVLLDNKLC